MIDMLDGTPKRKLYDSVFCSLFQDPRYQLELYQALHPENRNVTVDDIKEDPRSLMDQGL
jgi:hypothetical protein